MGARKRTIGQRLIHGACGALLAALSAISALILWSDFIWWPVGICTVFGFFLAWFMGGEAIEFLKTVFWWS